MDSTQWRIVAMTREYAEQIAQWRYDGIYHFYDHAAEDVAEFMDGSHHACVDPCGVLIGYYCFGGDARIPTVERCVYEGAYLDVGLGLRPDLCGRGLGYAFMQRGLRHAVNALDAAEFRLSVAAFNVRAIKLYERIGFRSVREATNLCYQNTFMIMIRDSAIPIPE